MRRVSSLVLLAAALTALGCGGVTAEHPLTIPLGLDHAATEQRLEQHRYCPKDGEPPTKLETYPRCERPGPEWGESWVVARYDADRLSELRRYERFTDANRAVERWNQLVADRAKLSPADPDALRRVKDTRLEPGTRSVKVFRVDATTIVAVYLLQPTPPEDASILEAILRAP